MEASITFKSVGKKFNDETLIAELSFGIEKNTKFVLLGPNGSGKSTILKLVCGLLYKDKGSIYVKGHDINVKSNKIKSIIGYMPQIIDIDSNLTIFENIYLYAQLHGLNNLDAKERTLSILNELNIINFQHSYPKNLSYAVLRIAMFARASVHNPKIMLLDEPTLNLDPVFKEVIWKYIYEFCSERTVFYSTQNFKEAEDNSDRIAILYDGAIKYSGSFDYLVENTYGLARFVIAFKSEIPDAIKKNISLNSKIIKPVIVDNRLKFYSTDKTEFFKILKDSFSADICDIDSSKCSLEDIFKGIDEGEK